MDYDSTESIRKELERLRSSYDDLRLEVDQLIAAESSSHDFGLARKRGILASAGTTAESVLKFIYRRERKDQGDKPCHSMTLDQLIPPLRDQVPPHVEVHLRTVQAWRNMGTHDKGDISKVDEASIQGVSNALSQVIVWFFDDYMNGEFADLAQRNGLETAHNPRPEANLKHYLYVSRTKVKMLYAQIPSAHRHNLASQLNVDLPLDQTTTPAEGIADDALLTETKLVVQFLEDQGKVGTVEKPNAYFKGQLPLRWGPYAEDLACELVYFGGATEKTTLGLGGSLKHVLGQLGGSYPSSSCPSHASFIVDVLTHQLSTAADDDLSDYLLEGIESASTHMSGPEENIEFVARKLFFEGGVLLGSPIYAALADT